MVMDEPREMTVAMDVIAKLSLPSLRVAEISWQGSNIPFDVVCESLFHALRSKGSMRIKLYLDLFNQYPSDTVEYFERDVAAWRKIAEEYDLTLRKRLTISISDPG